MINYFFFEEEALNHDKLSFRVCKYIKFEE